MKRCDWCQEIAILSPIVNRDQTSSHSTDWICPSCADVERFEHAHELSGNPIGFIPARYRHHVSTTRSLDELYS